MEWLAPVVEKAFILINHLVAFLANNFWVIYGIGFVAILIITALAMLLFDEDVVSGVCACGFVMAIFWPLIAFGSIMIGMVYITLCLLSLICYAIMGVVYAPFKTKQIIQHWKKWRSFDLKKRGQIGEGRKRVLHYLWTGEESHHFY